MAIHDGRQVAPLGADFEVGDVAHPNLIEVLNRQAVDLAANAIKEAARAGHSPVQVEGIGSNAMLSHKPLHPAAPNRQALSPQRLVDPRAAVDLPVLAVDCPDRLNQMGIVNVSPAHWAAAPSVIASWTHSI